MGSGAISACMNPMHSSQHFVRMRIDPSQGILIFCARKFEVGTQLRLIFLLINVFPNIILSNSLISLLLKNSVVYSRGKKNKRTHKRGATHPSTTLVEDRLAAEF